jgi:hypothetical protein
MQQKNNVAPKKKNLSHACAFHSEVEHARTNSIETRDEKVMEVEPAVRKCDICEATFSYASGLKRHVKTKRHALLAAIIKEECEVVVDDTEFTLKVFSYLFIPELKRGYHNVLLLGEQW